MSFLRGQIQKVDTQRNIPMGGPGELTSPANLQDASRAVVSYRLSVLWVTLLRLVHKKIRNTSSGETRAYHTHTNGQKRHVCGHNSCTPERIFPDEFPPKSIV